MSATPAPPAPPTLLDGPMGTELLRRGVPTPLPGWSAHALSHAAEQIAAIHRDYAAAGAEVHTTNTFRTQPRYFPDDWRDRIRIAVACAGEGKRATAGGRGRIAGSIAPLADCYTPEESPAAPGPEHRRVIEALAEEGVDLLLVETFPHVEEALAATAHAVATGLPTWVSLTPGPDANLLSPHEVRAGAARAVAAGAQAVLVNCLPTARVDEYLPALAACGVPFGAFANAGAAHDEVGFTEHPIPPEEYATTAAGWWRERGATILGACCGTGPEHIRALRRRWPVPEDPRDALLP